MANRSVDNMIIVDAASANALTWPQGARVRAVTILANDTTAAVRFVHSATDAVLHFRFLVSASMGGTTVIQSYHVIPFFGASFPTAWIPTTVTACTAWIHFE